MKKVATNQIGKWISAQMKLIVLGLLLISGVLLSAIVASTATRQEIQTNEQCIRCHVQLFNTSLRQTYTHVPFFERQCTACHLAPGTEAANTVSQQDKPITGSIVDQQDLWRKLQIYKESGDPAFDHLVMLEGLDPSTAYRFRIAVSPLAETSKEEVRSLWMGLRVDEVEKWNSAEQLDLSSGLATAISQTAGSASAYRSGEELFISWQTTRPLYGWVELQELEGLNLAELTPDSTGSSELDENQNQHPPLRDPEELAINACYQCHPESTLGTSHPVRLYGGRDVRIPDDLPTVDGMLTCVTCHDPHGSDGKMLVREVVKTKLCVTCHYKYKNSSPSTMFQ